MRVRDAVKAFTLFIPCGLATGFLIPNRNPSGACLLRELRGILELREGGHYGYHEKRSSRALKGVDE